MTIAGILFDLDETLHSREAAFWAWIREESHTLELDLERVAQMDARGRGPKDALLGYLASRLHWPEAALDQRLARFRAGMARHIKPDPRVRDMLRRLRAAFRIGLVSNGTSKTQRATISALGLEHCFDPIVISEEAGFQKPQPEIFWTASGRWPIPPKDILFVGDDEIADIDGAQNAGMQALRVSGGRAKDASCIGAVTELEEWLVVNESPGRPE